MLSFYFVQVRRGIAILRRHYWATFADLEPEFLRKLGRSACLSSIIAHLKTNKKLLHIHFKCLVFAGEIGEMIVSRSFDCSCRHF